MRAAHPDLPRYAHRAAGLPRREQHPGDRLHGAEKQQLHGGARGEAGGEPAVEEVYLGNVAPVACEGAGAKNLDDANNYERGLHGADGAVS